MRAHPLATSLALACLALSPVHAVSAHCDSMEGPVIRDARTALDAADPSVVLKWVSAAHEPEIRAAFSSTMAVRNLGADARRLADHYFFETLVRTHRAGEGEAFTGLKPAGQVDPGLAAADKALETGSGTNLAKLMAVAVEQGVRTRFEAAREARKHANESVEAGRRYVEAYVEYVHFVENLDRLARYGAPHSHVEPASHPEE